MFRHDTPGVLCTKADRFATIDTPRCVGRKIVPSVVRDAFACEREGKRMASGFIGNEVPRKGLRVRAPCPPP